ncbi:AMP-binding protein [Psychromicrobium xiongbiense]|uniref:AMP-binding protein n=1 Tax=Psychromicrobium xiongbiense TaxID=3051184 RepID=UPI0025524D5F|nr:AMP-binding protein [Psychromicrobium sp. YIM S02556]
MMTEPLTLDGQLKALAAALAGEGPAVFFGPDGAHLIEAPEGVAVVVGTSGSTGAAKATMLSVDALAASSMATAMALGARGMGGEGQWLLALPTHYVAGVQVLVRSLFAGTRPEVMAPGQNSSGQNGVERYGPGKFSTEAFIAAAQEMVDPVRLTSLVPTQLQRLIDDPAARGVLRRFNAILLGGAPASEALLSRARELGLRLVLTYGSAETCGGCVYDGEPLEDVEIALRPDERGNMRIYLGGATLADGYLNDARRTAASFEEVAGLRWYRTDDIGEFDDEGRLLVIGRADDVIITGGLKVSAAEVAARLSELDGVRQAFVAGLDDAEWGQRLVAAVEREPGSTVQEDHLRQLLSEVLPAEAVPKLMLILEELPLLPQGKLDRQTLLRFLETENTQRSTTRGEHPHG